MKIVDQIAVPLGTDHLWEILTQKFQQVAQCLPGLSQFTWEEENRYHMAMDVKVGPVALNFVGQLVLSVVNSTNMMLRVESEAQDTKMGSSTSMVLTIQLKGNGEESVILVDLEVDVRGKAASLGWGMIRPKAKSLMKDFAKNIQQLVTEPST